jgi:hypothetical protein
MTETLAQLVEAGGRERREMERHETAFRGKTVTLS